MQVVIDVNRMQPQTAVSIPGPCERMEQRKRIRSSTVRHNEANP